MNTEVDKPTCGPNRSTHPRRHEQQRIGLDHVLDAVDHDHTFAALDHDQDVDFGVDMFGHLVPGVELDEVCVQLRAVQTPHHAIGTFENHLAEVDSKELALLHMLTHARLLGRQIRKLLAKLEHAASQRVRTDR